MSGGDKYEDAMQYGILFDKKFEQRRSLPIFRSKWLDGEATGSLRYRIVNLYEKVEPENKSSSTKYRFYIIISDENSNNSQLAKPQYTRHHGQIDLGMDIDKLTDLMSLMKKNLS